MKESRTPKAVNAAWEVIVKSMKALSDEDRDGSGLILRILHVKSWRVLLLISFCLSIGTYLLFDKLLGIDLPVGILARLGL